jgi:hypothetical protein
VAGPVVDTETAREFMRETLEKVSEDDLAAITAALERKSLVFTARLGADRLVEADRDDLEIVLRNIFSTRRKAGAILDEIGPERLAAETEQLLRGAAALPLRFARFRTVLAAWPEAAFDVPSELLHFAYPDRYWLWTRWMWDPRTETGALALVTDEGFDLGGDEPGATYLRVGEAVAFVSETGQAAGFTAIESGPFGVDVFLGCVYAVYMYTVLRLRMTQEFNRIVPDQPELVRRLLGVHRLEV